MAVALSVGLASSPVELSPGGIALAPSNVACDACALGCEHSLCLQAVKPAFL